MKPTRAPALPAVLLRLALRDDHSARLLRCLDQPLVAG